MVSTAAAASTTTSAGSSRRPSRMTSRGAEPISVAGAGLGAARVIMVEKQFTQLLPMTHVAVVAARCLSREVGSEPVPLTPAEISAIDAAHVWHPYSTIGAEAFPPVV